jgi:hypothetical protein
VLNRTTAPTLSPRLLILGCSATKNHAAGFMPAVERYTGPLWQTLRAHDPDGTRCQVAYVSALYGIGCARTGELGNYELRLEKHWAERWARTGAPPFPDTARNHKRLRDMEHDAAPCRAWSEICLCGGALYLDVMLAEIRRYGLPPGTGITIINGQIGTMRAQLAQWLRGEIVSGARSFELAA